MDLRVEGRVFRKLSVYQDVVLAGQTVLAGQRDCPGRWQVLDPHLAQSGSILDVGSNFGWFGLQICQSRPHCVVASVEADQRSAAVQRLVLQSHQSQRICLLTQPAGASLARRFAEAGQRFDAALCLSVLHWIADHREFLRTLGAFTGRLLIEQPDPREAGSGIDRLREEIGPIGAYLSDLFPDRPASRLAQWPSHRQTPFPRELWLVAEPPGWPMVPSPGLDVSALLALRPGWPPRSWWSGQLDACAKAHALAAARPTRVLLTPSGLQIHDHPGTGKAGQWTPKQLRRRARRVPEHRALSLGQIWYRRTRRLAGTILRRLKVIR